MRLPWKPTNVQLVKKFTPFKNPKPYCLMYESKPMEYISNQFNSNHVITIGTYFCRLYFGIIFQSTCGSQK